MTLNYAQTHRALQDRFDTRRMADTLMQAIVRDELDEQARAFVAARDMFWLASIDSDGQPTVSYKGGAPGFVAVLDSRTIAFPCYDGNGMYYSMGNIAAQPNIGMLFMDFEKPFRLRVQGQARLDESAELMARFPGAQLAVKVAVTTVFQNCPRYVHRMHKVAASRYVPDAQGQAPLAGWKRIDVLQDSLPHYDEGRAAAAGGLQTMEEWQSQAAGGDPAA